MSHEDNEQIDAAQAVFGGFRLREDFSAGTVGAAIRTAGGNIYTGICIDLACGLRFCAEVAAVAEMLKHRETQITTAVAIGANGVLGGPCGRCREMIVQVDRMNLNCKILLPDVKDATLAELLPAHWLEDRRNTDPNFPGDG